MLTLYVVMLQIRPQASPRLTLLLGLCLAGGLGRRVPQIGYPVICIGTAQREEQERLRLIG